MAAPQRARGQQRPRGRLLLLVLVLLGVTFVTLSDDNGNSGIFAKARTYARQVADPFQSAVHSALRPVGNFLYGATHYEQFQQQNAALRREVAADQSAAVAASAESQEAAQALRQDHLDFVGDIPSVAAQVVGLGSANFEQSVEVNRGTANGIAVGQPVVSAGGLVGRVSAASSHLATVTLIDDPSSVVGARVVRTGVLGALTGEGAGHALKLDDVNVDSHVRKGDKLVTSGLQLEGYPPGLPIGTVTSVSSPTGALQLVVNVKPMAGLVNLGLVRVLLWSSQSG